MIDEVTLYLWNQDENAIEQTFAGNWLVGNEYAGLRAGDDRQA